MEEETVLRLIDKKGQPNRQVTTWRQRIKAQYQAIFTYLRGHRQWCWLSALLIIEFTVFVCLKVPPDNHYESYVSNTVGRYPNLFTFILGENILSSLLMILSGTLPFGLGVLFCAYSVFGSLCSTVKWLLPEYGVRKILLGTVFHGVFELAALLFSVLLSVLWCRAITLAILQLIGRRPMLAQFKLDIIFLTKTILFVLVPLLLVAASVEVTITAWIVQTLK